LSSERGEETIVIRLAQLFDGAVCVRADYEPLAGDAADA
jgi:hypothetical protein